MVVKEQIDIEALLHRAYAVYQIDRAIRPRQREATLWTMLGMPPSPGLAVPNYAERVDTSAPGAKAAARAKAATSAPDPLLDLHDRVLALADYWFGWSGDEIAVWDIASAAEAGCTIGKAGNQWWLERAGQLLAALEQAGVMALVIQHAREGSRPPVHLDWRARAGRRPADAGSHDRRGRARKGDVATEREVRCDRALYHVWHCALVLLQAEVADILPGYEVSGPLAPAAPWLVARDDAAESEAKCQNVIADKPLEELA